MNNKQISWIKSASQCCVALSLIGFGVPAVAQLVPDGTLGAENSRVTPNATVRGASGDLIEGGAVRGSNLFQSFLEFNVRNGQRVYFANPIGVQNIFSRITGANASNILGTLGVDGGANLFLLNPNGILFGPNAQLDVRGSFLATTASIKFADGSNFGATNPQTAPLLTMSAPVGVQYGANPTGTIQNRGNLTVGQDLTLAANNLDLQGQLQAGRDLTLQAQDTVQIRDTTTQPFLARSGGNLTIQGNQSIDILALNHRQASVQSGGNLSLISNGTISGDSHFTSGGTFSILNLAGSPGSFSSLYDPIIYANGDVTFGNYTGAALKVEATGGIQAGNITINAPDTTVPTTDPDFAILTTQPALILRAGMATVSAPNIPGTAGGTSFILTTLLPGITVGNVNTISGGNGGAIILSAAQGNVSTGALASYSYPASGNSRNGGAITLTATNGNISTESLSSFSYSASGNSQNGGAITLTATNGNIFTGSLASNSYSASGNSRNGGAITLTATNGSILNSGSLHSFSYSANGNSGNGGAITLAANNLSVSLGNSLYSYSYSEKGTSGAGGAIALTATNGVIANSGDLNATSDSGIGSANGGAITLTATNGSISNTGFIGSYSNSDSGNSGNGGAITLTAKAIANSNSGILDSSATSSNGFNSGNGGAIDITATDGSIRNDGILNSLSFLFPPDDNSSAATGTSGSGGAIFLNASNGDIFGDGSGILNSFSIAGQGQSGNGGTVNLVAKNTISGLQVFTLSSAANGGTVQIAGTGDLSLTGVTISTSKQATVLNPAFDPTKPTGSDNPRTIASDVGGVGKSGDVVITGVGNLTFNNSSIQSDTKGSGAAGNVTVSSPGVATFNNSQIISNTSSSGQAGSIAVTTGQGITLADAGSQLLAQTEASGSAGSITLNTAQLTIRNGAQVNTSSREGAGAAGNLNITANRVLLDNGGQLKAEATSGTGGNITINVQDHLLLRRNSEISTTAGTPASGGNGGNITINAPKGFLIAVPSENSDIIANAFGGKGGTITIAANRVFGLQTRDRLSQAQLEQIRNNGTSDISASSDIGLNGTISISTLQIDPSQGLAEIPVDLIDPSSLIAQGCQPGNTANATRRSEFVVTGRGGLPPGPADVQTEGEVSVPWVSQGRVAQAPHSEAAVASTPDEPLVEAQGIAIAPNGTAFLTAQTAIATPAQSGFAAATCPRQ